MKFCLHCGKEIMDEAVVCPNCGCGVENKSTTNSEVQERESASKASVILGIIGIVGGLLFALLGHICSIISIIIGIGDCTKKKKPTGLIIGIIGEVVSIFSSIIGAATMASLF